MPFNKNQHFVPRCHLRPFTQDAEGKAINLFNLNGDRAILGAPVKGQCSGDYFYGDDPNLEQRIRTFEDRYGSLAEAISEPGYQLTDADGAFLKEFWLLQYLRTDAAARREVDMLTQMDEDLGGLPPGYLPGIKEAVQTAMRIFFDSSNATADLKVRLVRNGTNRPFITSDNPAVMTNRWHLTDGRTELFGAGIMSAGAIGLLPLAPEALCVLYDGDLHSLPHQGKWIELANPDDVDAFNEHQILSCQANLYFRQWMHRAYVARLTGAVAKGRPTARHRLQYAVLDGEEGDTKTFRVVSAEEARGHQHSMVHHATVLPMPSRWPSILRWRPGGVVYDSGSGSGFARKGTREPDANYAKVKVRP